MIHVAIQGTPLAAGRRRKRENKTNLPQTPYQYRYTHIYTCTHRRTFTHPLYFHSSPTLVPSSPTLVPSSPTLVPSSPTHACFRIFPPHVREPYAPPMDTYGPLYEPPMDPLRNPYGPPMASLRSKKARWPPAGIPVRSILNSGGHLTPYGTLFGPPIWIPLLTECDLCGCLISYVIHV